MKRRTPAAARGVDHVRGAGDIDRVEGGAIGRVDQAGDMDDRIGAVSQRRECVAAVERAFEPCHAGLFGLRAAGERADLMARGKRGIDQSRADEAGGAGEGDGAPGHKQTPFVPSLGMSTITAATI